MEFIITIFIKTGSSDSINGVHQRLEALHHRYFGNKDAWSSDCNQIQLETFTEIFGKDFSIKQTGQGHSSEIVFSATTMVEMVNTISMDSRLFLFLKHFLKNKFVGMSDIKTNAFLEKESKSLLSSLRKLGPKGLSSGLINLYTAARLNKKISKKYVNRFCIRNLLCVRSAGFVFNK